jgi:hypothetical protein
LPKAEPTEISPTVAKVSPPKVSIPKESGKPKATLNLGNILKPPVKEQSEEKPKTQLPDRAFTPEELAATWQQFSETKKNQVAEYHLLSRGYELNGSTLHVTLANPVEEPLLLGLKTELVGFLRERLGNNTIQVSSHIKQVESQKFAYTNKEKFDAMAQQNPMLLRLKDRFGLDPDF